MFPTFFLTFPLCPCIPYFSASNRINKSLRIFPKSARARDFLNCDFPCLPTLSNYIIFQKFTSLYISRRNSASGSFSQGITGRAWGTRHTHPRVLARARGGPRGGWGRAGLAPGLPFDSRPGPRLRRGRGPVATMTIGRTLRQSTGAKRRSETETQFAIMRLISRD